MIEKNNSCLERSFFSKDKNSVNKVDLYGIINNIALSCDNGFAIQKNNNLFIDGFPYMNKNYDFNNSFEEYIDWILTIEETSENFLNNKNQSDLSFILEKCKANKVIYEADLYMSDSDNGLLRSYSLIDLIKKCVLFLEKTYISKKEKVPFWILDFKENEDIFLNLDLFSNKILTDTNNIYLKTFLIDNDYCFSINYNTYLAFELCLTDAIKEDQYIDDIVFSDQLIQNITNSKNYIKLDSGNKFYGIKQFYSYCLEDILEKYFDYVSDLAYTNLKKAVKK